MSMLEIDKVSKLYKSGTFGGGLKAALRQVSFNIERGEVVSLIGESGSGKSTLGKIILRLVPPSAGCVRFEGADITQMKGRALHEYYRYVQGVFQDPFSSYNPLYKVDRVFDMVHQEFFPHLSGDEWAARVGSALEAVTLNPGDVFNKFPHQLSGGQQQRVLVARALLLDVKLLIADEIISMLDASTRVDVLNMLVGLKKRGLGILFITHDLSLGNYISDRTVILRNGTIAEMGLTPLVFGNPRHSYTVSLLKAVPQLHKKWEDIDIDELLAAELDREAPALAPRGPESRRYSKSSLAPARQARAKDILPQGEQGPRPSLMDLPGAPWQRKMSSPRLAKLLLSQPPPELVEVEEGHFVAVEG